jgi:DNA-binding transcriptional ArsR family regulator
MVGGSEQTANEILGTLKLQKLELSKDIFPFAEQVAASLDMSRATVMQAYEAFYSKDIVRYRQLTETLQAQLEQAKLKSEPVVKVE